MEAECSGGQSSPRAVALRGRKGTLRLFIVTDLYTDKCGGQAVAQLVEALFYKPESRGFEPR
jgi:hypothetical protein